MSLAEVLILIGIIILIIETTIILVADKSKLLKSGNKRKVYIDTSALMDGRILSIAETGFIGDELYIPRSVIRELQLLADSKDSEKRTRARSGLDAANDLQRVDSAHVEIVQDELDRTPVDERLIQLALKNHGLICTMDYNLNKVAATEGIEVLNVNELAMVLKSEYVSGQQFKIKITSKGSNPGQGIGHLSDGTMVVVDNAANKVNKELNVQVLRFIQTSAGRIIFTKIVSTRSTHKKSA